MRVIAGVFSGPWRRRETQKDGEEREKTGGYRTLSSSVSTLRTYIYSKVHKHAANLHSANKSSVFVRSFVVNHHPVACRSPHPRSPVSTDPPLPVLQPLVPLCFGSTPFPQPFLPHLAHVELSWMVRPRTVRPTPLSNSVSPARSPTRRHPPSRGYVQN